MCKIFWDEELSGNFGGTRDPGIGIREFVDLVVDSIYRNRLKERMKDREALSVEEQNALKRKRDGNDRCADCGKKFPIWVSLSYGIVICLNCAGHHRSLGVHLSRVRSIPLDSWTEKDKICMQIGSNKRWAEALRRTRAPDRLMPSLSSKGDGSGAISAFNAVLCREKYTSNVAKYYREALKRNVSKALKKGKRKRGRKRKESAEEEEEEFDRKCSSEPSATIQTVALQVNLEKDLPKKWISDPDVAILSDRASHESLETAKRVQIRARFGQGGGGVEFARRRREQEARESALCGIL